LLQCLVVAVRPLLVEELAEVLAFDFNVGGTPQLNQGWRWEDQEEAVMSACSSLVTIIDDGRSRVVQFSHFSVKEFLTADRLAEPIRDVSRYYIRLEAAHTILALPWHPSPIRRLYWPCQHQELPVGSLRGSVLADAWASRECVDTHQGRDGMSV
jgi:hypothetical protein